MITSGRTSAADVTSRGLPGGITEIVVGPVGFLSTGYDRETMEIVLIEGPHEITKGRIRLGGGARLHWRAKDTQP